MRRAITLAVAVFVGTVAFPPTAAAIHGDYITKTWRTEWEECGLLSCGTQTMAIEVRRIETASGGPFTIEQQSRILNAMGEINALETGEHLLMVDAGVSPYFWPDCTSRGASGYNWNTVRWAGEDPNYAGVAYVNWFNNEICNFNIEYYADTNRWYDWYFGYTGTGEDEAHWLHTVLHEFGHGIGFGIAASQAHFDDFANCPSDGTNHQEIMCNFWYAEMDYISYRPSERGVFKHAYS